MTISVFSVPYNSSTFDVGVIERWIVIIGGKLCHFRSSPVGKATSRSGVTYHSKSGQRSQVCYPPLSCRMRFFISRRLLKNRGYACKLYYSCFCLFFEAEHVVHHRSSTRSSFLSLSIRLMSNAFDWQTSKFGQL